MRPTIEKPGKRPEGGLSKKRRKTVGGLTKKRGGATAETDDATDDRKRGKDRGRIFPAEKERHKKEKHQKGNAKSKIASEKKAKRKINYKKSRFSSP